jgi:CBS domain containing-hemolysin-like protein
MEISIIIICLVLAALFSGMEIAFVSSNKIYLEIEKKQQNFISKILTKLVVLLKLEKSTKRVKMRVKYKQKFY